VKGWIVVSYLEHELEFLLMYSSTYFKDALKPGNPKARVPPFWLAIVSKVVRMSRRLRRPSVSG
jgi:hypothetical protein